jgi:hypothetical protein
MEAFIIFTWCFWAVLCGILADKKNRSIGWGIVSGFIFGIFAVIYYLCVSKQKKHKGTK